MTDLDQEYDVRGTPLKLSEILAGMALCGINSFDGPVPHKFIKDVVAFWMDGVRIGLCLARNIDDLAGLWDILSKPALAGPASLAEEVVVKMVAAALYYRADMHNRTFTPDAAVAEAEAFLRHIQEGN